MLNLEIENLVLINVYLIMYEFLFFMYNKIIRNFKCIVLFNMFIFVIFLC